MVNKEHLLRFDFGKATQYTPNLRITELKARFKWFINLRWLGGAACLIGALVSSLSILPVRLTPIYFVVTALFLAMTNTGYIWAGRRILAKPNYEIPIKWLVTTQMGTDFIGLSLLTYACGTIESPMITMFMAHIILATAFFSRNRSFLVVVGAWVFATLPLLLEWMGMVPVHTIFDSDFKSMVIGSSVLTIGFIIAIGLVFWICWYLMSAIGGSLKLRELQLEEAYAMMVQMDKEKTQATLRATHELKAPFAAIKSYVYTLRDGYCGPLPEKARKVVGRIGDRCDHLSHKITDIIHLSNLKTLLVSDVDMMPVEMVSLIEEEVEEGALIGEPRGIVVTHEIPSNAPKYVMGSKVHLKTLLSNLIRNAVIYSHDQKGRVQLRLTASEDILSVSVRDNGIGIPEESFDKIFDEHFRTKNAVSHSMAGSGLGLSLVREIVRLHGATISLESTVGVGTTFTVSFTLLKEKPERENHGTHNDH